MVFLGEGTGTGLGEGADFRLPFEADEGDLAVALGDLAVALDDLGVVAFLASAFFASGFFPFLAGVVLFAAGDFAFTAGDFFGVGSASAFFSGAGLLGVFVFLEEDLGVLGVFAFLEEDLGVFFAAAGDLVTGDLGDLAVEGGVFLAGGDLALAFSFPAGLVASPSSDDTAFLWDGDFLSCATLYDDFTFRSFPDSTARLTTCSHTLLLS
mmetsp:Transcript_9588/g.15735  ORF Transcript_9588/g.15735 Transcript_9588/m.15735 type:complete len:210 (+) Transcript_9588:431-1060(+)|eukprot:CAMPEP_0184657092 /NCGR_PEP_ID=MMETSP0308-20130426/16971_1 /TAXON_ID=38269 /ORGANISM="Gloeochaete witrockiana, Strain SAG 46.84" /LENGTH=209 /DNA_ID=CAMNT_0027094499 /DNA_START=413 /DNA_END=1042 /DNA_ORIENTATION=-